MISRRQIFLGSAGPIFTIFTPNESVLGADDRSGPVFSISPGTLPWQPILWKKLATPQFRGSGIQKRNGVLARWTLENDQTYDLLDTLWYSIYLFLAFTSFLTSFFTARGYAKRSICHRRVSVCLSHSGIVSKRLNVGSRR